MKLTTQVVLAVLCLAAAAFARPETENWQTSEIIPQNPFSNVEEKFMTQNVDHLNASDTRTWYMRYIVNDYRHKLGGPMFLILGGQHQATEKRLIRSYLEELAAMHQGVLVQIEHRYYGTRWNPTHELSLDNLKYLTMEQALADAAEFIRTKKTFYTGSSSSKVIVAGSTYAGSMAIWLKRVYPELVDGVWASSAPLHAKMNFYERYEAIGDAIKNLGGQQCYDSIQNGIAELEAMFDTDQFTEVRALLKICPSGSDFLNKMDEALIFESLARLFAGIVESQEEDDMAWMCDFFRSDDDINGVVNLFLLGLEKATCWSFNYAEVIGNLSDVNNRSGQRPWFYQACNELGWFQNTESPNQPFGTKVTLQFFSTICGDLFGKDYANSSFLQDKIRKTNNIFGGMNHTLTNVYRSFGEFDGWKVLGHQKGDDADIIARATQASDIRQWNLVETPSLEAARNRINDLVTKWIGKSTVIQFDA